MRGLTPLGEVWPMSASRVSIHLFLLVALSGLCACSLYAGCAVQISEFRVSSRGRNPISFHWMRNVTAVYAGGGLANVGNSLSRFAKIYMARHLRWRRLIFFTNANIKIEARPQLRQIEFSASNPPSRAIPLCL